MGRHQSQKSTVTTTQKGQLIKQVVAASIIIVMVCLVAVFSIKQESSVADHGEKIKQAMEVIQIDDAADALTISESLEANTTIDVNYIESDELLEIDFTSAIENTVQLKLQDAYGQIIATESIRPGIRSLTYKLNLDEPGVYTLHTITSDQTYTKKIVIAK